MSDRPPTVSACLLTYKRASVLRRTIEDILGQTFGDFELVINDDRSPDDTEQICREFEARDSRVRYFRNDRNLRYAGNQNAAVSRARGKYIAFLHDGDRYSPRLLERWVRALEAHPGAGIVFNAIDVLDERGAVSGGFDPWHQALTPGLSMHDAMLMRLDSPIFGIVMTRGDALRSTGRFDESLPYLADVDMWLRMLLEWDVAYERERLYAVYPREPDHANRHVNWAIRDELARIYRSACDRRHTPSSRAWHAARLRIDLNLLRMDAWSIGSCVKARRWQVAAKGASVFAAHLSSATGKQLMEFARSSTRKTRGKAPIRPS